jgi:hypothetical protein
VIRAIDSFVDGTGDNGERVNGCKVDRARIEVDAEGVVREVDDLDGACRSEAYGGKEDKRELCEH